MTVTIDKWSGLFNKVTDDIIAAANVGDTFNATQAPIGTIVAWHKTFVSVDSGTTSSTTANKLVDSTQNFLVTVNVGNMVFNSTDSTFAYVTAVDSNTTLSLSADIVPTVKAYTIYATPRLPDSWVECNGQVLSDTDSPFNGATIPSINGTSEATKTFLRGVKSTTTGGVGGSSTMNLAHSHTGFTATASSPSSTVTPGSAQGITTGHRHTISSDLSAAQASVPVYAEMTWVIRIK